MIYRTLGKTELEVSAVGLRGWSARPGEWAAPAANANEVISAFQTALELGVNYVEVAAGRTVGLGDEAAARALAGAPGRVYVAGVCGAGDGARVGRRDQIIQQCEEGLRRLHIERWDAFYCRWPEVAAPMPEVIEALSRLHERGEAGIVGLSQYAYEHVSEARRAGVAQVVRSSLNVLEREDGHDLIPYCQEHGLPVIAGDPFCHELLRGGFTGADAGTHSSAKVFRSGRFGANVAAAERLSAIASEGGMTLRQLALAWALGQPGVTMAVTAVARPSEVREQTTALGRTIPEEIGGRIDDTLSERDRQLDR